MSAQATHATPPDDPGPQAADAHYYRQALHGLIDMGTDLARLLHGQATAQAAPQATPAPHATAPTPQPADPQPAPTPAVPSPVASAALVSLAAAFDQVARAVRRCIALARTLAAAPDPARHRTAARQRILREVEDRIQCTSGEGPDSPGALHAELRERLDAPDLDDAIATRPVADVIKDICRDLGLGAAPGTRPFQRRTPADVAQLCARAAAPTPARQPGAAPQAPLPQAPRHGTPHPTFTPRPERRPAAPPVPRAQPAPAHPGSRLPEDPAEAVAAVLHHPAQARWRPPIPG